MRDGGGLLVTGGADAFGSGGWQGSRLEPLLPVLLDLPEREDETTLALALAIDRSGSMAGPKMDLTKEAARATVEMMPPADQIAVAVFDSRAQVIVPLQRASNRLRILADIGRIQASGGTDILAGLREACSWTRLASARARKVLDIILLARTDTSAREGIVELVDAASAEKITISTIGVGEGADTSLLRMIATRGGGRYYPTRDPASIPRIFSQETSQVTRRSIVEEPTPRPIARRNAPKRWPACRSRARLALDAQYAAGPPLARAPSCCSSDAERRAAPRALAGGPRPGRRLDERRRAALVGGLDALATVREAVGPGDARQRRGCDDRARNQFPLRATLDDDRVTTLAVDAAGADDRFLTGLDAMRSPRSRCTPHRRGARSPPSIALARRQAPGHSSTRAASAPDPPVGRAAVPGRAHALGRAGRRSHGTAGAALRARAAPARSCRCVLVL